MEAGPAPGRGARGESSSRPSRPVPSRRGGGGSSSAVPMVLMTEQRCDAEEWKAGRPAGRREHRSALHLSDGENGTSERRKPGKSPAVLLQAPTSEVERFDDGKKVDVARTKSSTESPLLTMDSKNDSKIERKKHISNQLKANAHFHKLFLDVSIDEPLKQSFTCALQKEILYQGKLFLSENWICFHSKVFGKDTKISIPVLSVTLLKKTKTALLVPNALIIATVTDRYMFVSLLSRDTTYKLLKSICRHLEDTSMGSSPNPSSVENSFRADRPTTLSLDFNEDYSDLDGIVQEQRQEMEESSSTGSQTPELERFQDYHVVETQTHLKVSKTETKSVRSDARSKWVPEGKARNCLRNGRELRADSQLKLVETNSYGYVSSPNMEDFFLVYLCLYYLLHASKHHCVSWCFLIKITLVLSLAGHSEPFRFFHKVKFQKLLSLNHILIFYAVLVCVLIFSTFYMRYKINVLEERLISIASFDSHVKEHPVHRGLESHPQINADAFCDELTANLIKLEKNNLQKLLEDGE
ncbi:GRAM domain-containing protein 3 isoform X2 [Numida meleagris]|uniref:GRAM domain-containing protein 3 isoform X2 n=1 Tax=Numida meleagris TaxID=8996 RepID=UPI000B3DCC04|nr:GRAM domain-containing protein 3 isoform X2 [Numida meleagris]